MRKFKRHKSTDQRPLSLCFLFSFLFLSLSAGCAPVVQQDVQRSIHSDIRPAHSDFIRNISFSPDGKTLIFNRQKGDGPYRIHTYHMETGDLTAYASPATEKWDYPQFSFDGKNIVFVTFPVDVIPATELHPEKAIENPDKSQIAVMETEGSNIRKITGSNGYKAYPSFSHSGRKIIFARSDVMERKPQVGIKWTVYEVDIKTGKESSLSEFKFFTITRPYYFPDDKTFIFGGEYLTGFPGVPDSNRDTDSFRKVEKKRKELKAKYKENSIYVQQANDKELKPFLTAPGVRNKLKKTVADSDYAKWPLLNADASVLIFKAQGFSPDGKADQESLYQYSSDGNHRSIAPIPPTENMAALSFDGELIAVIPRPSDRIMIYQVKDGKSREITLPDKPSRVIAGH